MSTKTLLIAGAALALAWPVLPASAADLYNPPPETDYEPPPAAAWGPAPWYVALRGGAPASGRPPSGNVPERHPFPTVTYEPASGLVASLARTAGAFPRDPMDERLSGYLTRPVDARPPAWRGDRGVEPSDALAPAAKVGRALEPDADGDGLPDAWERAHGLDPARDDHSGLTVGNATAGLAGYPNLEVYLHELAQQRLTEGPWGR